MVHLRSRPVASFHTRRVLVARRLRWGAALCAVGLVATSVAALAAPSASAATIPGGYNIQGKQVLLDIYDPESNSFFVPLENGAKAAAALFGLSLHIEFGDNSDTTAVTEIRTAVASHYAAIIAKTPDAAVANTACPAVKAGLIYIAVNQTAPSPCIKTYIGQTEFAAGAEVATYMVAQGLIKKGDNVFCPVESPQETYHGRPACRCRQRPR